MKQAGQAAALTAAWAVATVYAMPNQAITDPPRNQPGDRFFLIAVAVYLLLVHAWSLLLPPMGRDFERLQAPVFAPLLDLYGSHPALAAILAHLLNLVLLYLCMAAVYALTRLVLGRPYWLGSLAATLFMAHPLKSEAVLSFSGGELLLPSLLALAALAAYAAAHHHIVWLSASLLCYALLGLLGGPLVGLLLALVLYEALLRPQEIRGYWRLLPHAAICVLAMAMRWPLEVLPPIEARVGSLGFLFYPLGLLPETVLLYHAQPWLAYLAAAGVASAYTLLCWRLRSRVLVFMGICWLAFQVDPLWSSNVGWLSHEGGGYLLPSLGLWGLFAASVSQYLLRFPQWRKATVFLTTMLCVAFFALQIRVILDWYTVGEMLERLRRQAQQQQASEFVAAPGYTSFRTAPMDTAAALSAPPPLGLGVRAANLMPMPLVAPEKLRVRILKWAPPEADIALGGVDAQALLPYAAWAARDVPAAVTVSQDGVLVGVQNAPRGAPLPFPPE